LTFNNVIAEDAVTVIKTSDNSVVAGAKTFDSSGKILTFKPSTNLTSAGVYDIVIAGVKDIYGQTLATSVIKFTVA
jgi:dihydrofolate reductase